MGFKFQYQRSGLTGEIVFVSLMTPIILASGYRTDGKARARMKTQVGHRNGHFIPRLGGTAGRVITNMPFLPSHSWLFERVNC